MTLGKRILFTADLSGDITMLQLQAFWTWIKTNLGINPRTVNPAIINTADGKYCNLVFDEGDITVRKTGARLSITMNFMRQQDVTAIKQQIAAFGLTGITHTYEDETNF